MRLDRPVLITGTPRAGKSCVWRLLRHASEFAAVEEPLMLWDGAHPDRIERRAAALVRRAGKRRYLDNMSQHAVRLPFVRAVMPDMRLIHVIRDPVDTVPEFYFGWTNRDSIGNAFRRRRTHLRLRALPRHAWRFARNFAISRLRGHRESWGPSVPGLAEYARAHAPVEVAAYHWACLAEAARRGLADLPATRVLEVRYEELVASPRLVAERITAFAEVDDPAPCIDAACRDLRADYVHHEPCRRPPTPAEWRAIHAIIDPIRRELGYAEAKR